MKKLFVILFTFIIVLSLTGCGVNITSISLPDSLEVNKGETIDAVATFTAEQEDVTAEALAKAADKLELVWSSADENVATVDADGVVTGVSGGETEITVAATDGELSASVKVNVNVPAEDIDITDFEITTLDTDSEIDYALVPADATAKDVEFTVADKGIATVKDGKITAVAAGSTELTVTVGEVSKTVALKVLQAPVELTVDEISVRVGRTATINVNTGLEDGVEAEVGLDFTYTSADESIATVDEDGTVTGVEVGETMVTIANGLGQTVEETVTVKSRPVSYTPDSTSAPAAASTPAASTPAAAPAPAPAPAPSEPQHYHGNGTDTGHCPVCGSGYSPDIDMNAPTGNYGGD